MNTDQKTKTTPKSSIRDLLQGDEFKRQVSKALPRTITPERFARVALTATFRNPRLLECSQASLLQCLMDLSAMGLEPDGRRAHLIPFRDKAGATHCSLIIDYKGIAELVRRHGDVAHIHCDVVGENDQFECRFGSHGILTHTPTIGDRGPITCAYSFIRLKDGAEEYDLMSYEDIERIRKRSRHGEDGPWSSDWNEMAKKTVFRRHSKTLPLSSELRDAIERDDELPATEQERFSAARPATASVASPQRLSRGRPARTELDLEPQAEESAPSLPSPPSESEMRPTEEVADVPPTPVAAAAPQPPSLAARVATLLAENGYTVSELLDLLSDPSIKLANPGLESLEQCTPKALTMVLNDWENCKRRLDSKRVPQ